MSSEKRKKKEKKTICQLEKKKRSDAFKRSDYYKFIQSEMKKYNISYMEAVALKNWTKKKKKLESESDSESDDSPIERKRRVKKESPDDSPSPVRRKPKKNNVNNFFRRLEEDEDFEEQRNQLFKPVIVPAKIKRVKNEGDYDREHEERKRLLAEQKARTADRRKFLDSLKKKNRPKYEIEFDEGQEEEEQRLRDEEEEYRLRQEEIKEEKLLEKEEKQRLKDLEKLECKKVKINTKLNQKFPLTKKEQEELDFLERKEELRLRPERGYTFINVRPGNKRHV